MNLKVLMKYKNPLLLISLFIINFMWFYKMGSHYHVLMGDDLSAWNSFEQETSFLSRVLLNTDSQKYRPVWNLVQYVLFELFNNKYQLFFLVNILFNFIIVTSLYSLTKKINKGSSVVAFFISLIYLTSRFSFYNILQLNGLMEAICLLIIILILNYSFSFTQLGDYNSLYKIIILFFVLIFTHERFISLLPFIVLLIYYNKNLALKKKILLCSFPVAFVIFNIILKDIIFVTGFMVGTGGTNITFSPFYISAFIACGILNLLGFNVGPPYLNGEYIQNSKLYVQLFSFFISLITMGLIIFFIRDNKLDKRSNLMAVLTAILLISLLLLPAVLTIRLELRWVYAPFIVVLLLFAYIFGRIKSKILFPALILLTLFSLINNIYYKDNDNNSRVFFIRSQQASEDVYNETVKRYGQNITDYNIYIIKNSDFEWILSGDTFFKQFDLKKKLTVSYVDNIQDIKNNTENAMVFRFNDDTKKVENISNLILKQEELQ